MAIIKSRLGWRLSNAIKKDPDTIAVNIGEYSKDITRFYGIPGANAGKKNGMYSHGRWSTTNKPKKTSCKNCGSKSNLLYHHINHNETDNRKSNIRVLCKKCHERHHERGKNFTGKKSKNRSTKRVKNGKAYR